MAVHDGVRPALIEMLNLFRNKPLLDETTRQWLFEAYAWAFDGFDGDFFHAETILVTPTRAHFPARVDSRQSMAGSILEQMSRYAGMQNWPLELFEQGEDRPPACPERIDGNGILRGAAARVRPEGPVPAFPILYNAGLTRDPGLLTTAIARQLAGHLAGAAGLPGPGGEALRGHLVDLLAVFMGFGLFLANHAVVVQRGCSGCVGSVQATGFLSEDQLTYALALFCRLKGIPEKSVRTHLKSALRPLLKKAVREIDRDGGAECLVRAACPATPTSSVR